MVKQKFNKNWYFKYGTGSCFQNFTGETETVQKVQLPHDASIHLLRMADDVYGSGNGFFAERNCVYEKKFAVSCEDKSKNIWFEFEAVYQNSSVYINNSYAGKCPYGYGNFYIDATKFIKFGEENIIRVVVKNEVPSGRWYTGGGIYRDVNIMIANRLHIEADGVRISVAERDRNMAVLNVAVDIEYTGIGTRNVHLVTELKDTEGTVVACDKTAMTIFEGTKAAYPQKLYVQNPILWDAEHPYLYSYNTYILEDKEIVDEEIGTYGIRQLQLDPVNGLRINGKAVNLRGGCIHHDTGITGTAEFPHEEEFRIKRLKEAGFNAIRSSHYPMSRVLLNACDKYGMYVMDEFTDVWTSTKVPFDYGIYMPEWWEHDVNNIVKKDFNHPCVIIYSIGNEIPEAGNKVDVQWGKKIADRFKKLDPARYTTNSLNILFCVMDHLQEIILAAIPDSMHKEELVEKDSRKEENVAGEINSIMTELGDQIDVVYGSPAIANAIEEAASQVDITGYNYASVRYSADKELFPGRIIVGSETYPKDLDINWDLVEKMPNIIGDFEWTAWDYLGEAGIGKIRYGESSADTMGFYAPYPCKAAFCGDINLIGDRRPVSYWREIIWGLRSAPYIAVQPPKYYGIEKKMTDWCMTNATRSWNWTGYENQPIVVEVYSDAEEVELVVNGSVKERKAVGKMKKNMAIFNTFYIPGKIEVIAYIADQETGWDEIITASDKIKIVAAADVEFIPADGSDIGYIEVCLVDENDNFNSGVVKSISIEIEGPGVILGYRSADPDSPENYFDTTANTFEGRLRAAIRGMGEAGDIKVKFKAEGCESVVVTVPAYSKN